MLADWLVDADVQHGQLVELLDTWRAPGAPVYALTPAGKFTPTAVQTLLEHLAVTLPARLQC